LLVAGDAAGMVSPLSGEGIFYAVKAGLEAGRTAAEAVQSHDYSAAFLARYEDQLGSLWENLSYQAQIIEETLGQILRTTDERVHRKQYREGLIEGFLRYIGYMTKKMEIRKPVADYEMVKSNGI
jgi:flavin-dependent dehydrogenase